MRITTWNVNGIRNPFGYQPWNSVRTFPGMFDILEADVVIMQELKIQRKDLRDDMVLLDGWDCYFSLPKHKKGYSGVGIYTRNATCSPIRAEEGVLGVLSPPNTTTAYRDLPEDEHIGGYPSDFQIAELGVDPAMLDAEGRCVCLEFPAFVLFGVYSPANSNGLRDDFRYGFLCALDTRIRNLAKLGKRVILTGDLNVSRSEVDTASAVEDMRKAGITHDEYISTPNRRVFNQLVVGGDVIGEKDEGREKPILCDMAREFHPQRKGMFTHWEQKINARPGNFGSRIDYVLASEEMRDWFVDSDIQEGLMGSDHCPVFASLNQLVSIRRNDDTENLHLLDIMNPAGMFVNGARRTEWTVKSIPAMSGKLLPEFDKRRSIKDMFKKPNLAHTLSSTPSNNATSDSTATAATARATSDADVHAANGHNANASPAKSSAPASPSNGTDKKRKVSDATNTKSIKRQKSNPTNIAAKGETAKGQQSLKGFFSAKPKDAAGTNGIKSPERTKVLSSVQRSEPAHSSSLTPAPDPVADDPATPPDDSLSTSPTTKQAGAATPETLAQHSRPATVATAPDPPPPPSPSPSESTVGSSVHDPIVSKESWATMFRKPAAPQCEGHLEPCKSMLTKKKGENQGRSFWMCARPLGPSGNKENGTQWRCSTFIWCSDWKGDGQGI